MAQSHPYRLHPRAARVTSIASNGRVVHAIDYSDAEWRYRVEKEMAEVKHAVSIINDNLDYPISLISEFKEARARAEPIPKETLFLLTLQSRLVRERDHPSCVLIRLRDMRGSFFSVLRLSYFITCLLQTWGPGCQRRVCKGSEEAPGALPGLRELTRSQMYKGQRTVNDKLRTAVQRRKMIADEVAPPFLRRDMR